MPRRASSRLYYPLLSTNGNGNGAVDSASRLDPRLTSLVLSLTSRKRKKAALAPH